MKLYACDENKGYLCSFDATLPDESYKKVFKKFKKNGIVEKAYLRIDNNSKQGIKEAVEKLDLLMPLKVEVYPETIQSIRMPYSRRAGLDKVGKYISYYQAEIAIYSLPGLYFLIFDEDNQVRDDAIVNIWYYLNHQWNDRIKEVFEKVSPDDGYLDYALSESKQIALISAFLSSLDIVLSDVSSLPMNNTQELEQSFYLSDIKKSIDKMKNDTHKRKLK